MRFGQKIMLLAAFLLGSPAAWAALGQPVASVENDRVNMQGELKVIPGAGFNVHQITTPAGVAVKEYVTPSGVVFGVSWRGPVFPDLSLLLGKYITQFQRGASSQPSYRRRHIMVHTADFVAETGGHMRDLRGVAYLPGLLPPGVNQTAVK